MYHVAISYADQEQHYASMLRALLLECLSADHVFSYRQTPLPHENLASSIRDVFENALILVPIVGSTYQDESQWCQTEAFFAVDRLNKPSDRIAVVAAIDGTDPKGALKTALSLAQTEPIRLARKAASWRGFQTAEFLARVVVSKLQRRLGSAFVHRREQPVHNGVPTPIVSHLPGCGDLFDGAPRLQEPHREGVLSAAVLLGHLEQVQRAGNVKSGLVRVHKEVAKHESIVAPGWQLKQALVRVGEAILELIFALATKRERVEYQEGSNRIGLQCALLGRLRSYLNCHFSDGTLHQVPRLVEHLAQVLTIDEEASEWSLLAPQLLVDSISVAERLEARFWVSTEERWKVAAPRGVTELTDFREARQKEILRHSPRVGDA